jgi:hypothetical protein
MELPAPVSTVCRTFLELAPAGLVTVLHLRGGLAFGEWVSGHSDVDFVAVLDHRPDDAETAALAAAHVELHERHPAPWFDGLHVLAADLARDPDLLPPVPTVLEGTFDPAGRLDPLVAWHELARGGITVYGDPLGPVWTDPDRLRAFTVANLDTYWRRTAEALASAPESADCAWCVLGVTRLHHLLMTGEMTTKSAAGRWGLATYPARFHRVLREALAIREGGRSEYPADAPARGRDTAELTAYVVAAGTS